MSDWNHRQLGEVLDEVQNLQISEPGSIEHPSTAELEAYVEESLSPFVQASVDRHLEGCERCVAYLAEAFDRDSEARDTSHGDTGFGGWRSFDPLRLKPSPWLAAAAMWIVALPTGVWLASHFLAEPVVIQTRGADAVASQGTEVTRWSHVAETALSSGSTEGHPQNGIWTSQAQFEQAFLDLKQAVDRLADDRSASPRSVPALTREERRQLLEPLMKEFSQLAAQHVVEELYPDLRQQLAMTLDTIYRDGSVAKGVLVSNPDAGELGRRGDSKLPDWMGE